MAGLRVKIFYNPVAGGGRGAARAEQLAVALRARGCEADAEEADLDGERLARLDAARWDRLVILGGDGSFYAALAHVPSFSIPLAFYGQGTVNVLSRALRLPRRAEPFADLLVDDRRHELLTVPVSRFGDVRWLLFCEAGVVAAAIVRVNSITLPVDARFRALRKQLRVMGCFLRAAFSGRGRDLAIRFPDEPEKTPDLLFCDVLLARVRQYGGLFPMPVSGGLEQPQFEVIGFRTRWFGGHILMMVLAALRLLPALSGILVRLGLLYRARSSAVEIRSVSGGSAPIHLDAETHEAPLPRTASFEAGVAFRLVVPRRDAGA